MRDHSRAATFLKDYKQPLYWIKEIDLTFDLHDTSTLVVAKTKIEKKTEIYEPLILNGENLTLLAIFLNDVELKPDAYQLDDHHLILENLPSHFTLEIHTRINPSANTSLDGLYKSGNIFCTQNEPHGFRRMTYFLDRPDMMSVYTTKMIANQEEYPVLLSNGNEIDRGVDGEKHWVRWHDPFPKPCYLFALVAGDLGMISDTFTTQSNRNIDLRIYCDKGNEPKCLHAMKSLKKSMKWDEEVFGLEYDLDIFMIVAVDAFNFGAMENKGLNIFNTSCALADDKTATDDNFYRVESVIAHEYFHNWTGNRVTCRDWFQLTLKEGLTVYRDQEFSADMHSRSVKRVEDVLRLRAAQFPEDAGPTSHPIKPQSYIEINNFYTATIYEKGAEIIRMIHTLLGDERFKKGIEKYFELYDGQAVTTEDFIHSMEVASGVSLKEFSRWYHQSGTPEVAVSHQYDPAKLQLTLKLTQINVPTADQKEKSPLYFPFKIGLMNSKGKSISFKTSDGMTHHESAVLIIEKEVENIILSDVEEAPILSLNRDFTAPIKLHAQYQKHELLFLMAHDSNEFCRWDAAQEIATQLMLESINRCDPSLEVDPQYIESFGLILDDPSLDDAFKALALTLPSEAALAERQEVIDFDGIHVVREHFLRTLAHKYHRKFLNLYRELDTQEPFSFDSVAVGKRALKNICLKYLTISGSKESIEIAYRQFLNANNMTDEFNALHVLANTDCAESDQALERFYERWKKDTLVMCKWFATQATSKKGGALERTRKLLSHPSFNLQIPNLVRALLGGFVDNHVQFHDPSGQGYSFIADMIIDLDKINPHVSARLATAFQKYARLDDSRKKELKKEMTKILSCKEISSNVYEIIAKCMRA